MEATAFWPDMNARQCFYYALLDARPDPLDEKTIKRIHMIAMEFENMDARYRCKVIERTIRRLAGSSNVDVGEVFQFYFSFASVQRALTLNDKTRGSWR